MDPRPTRKDAEKAARALLDARAKFIGDLRVAQDDVDGNADLLQRASADAEKILAEARGHVADITATATRATESNVAAYATTYKAATDAGWTAAELTTLGFPTAVGRKTRTKSVPTVAPAPDGGHGQDLH